MCEALIGASPLALWHCDGPARRVYQFVRDIVRRSIGAAVFTSGSTPLKTYLPDGTTTVTMVVCVGRSVSFIE